MLNEDKIRIVAHLISRNTFAPDLKSELLNYETDPQMYNVLALIADEWLVFKRLCDVYNYELFEIPDCGVYCFHNILNNRCFDVYLNDYNGNGKNCTFGYVDSFSVSQDANNVVEAIENYSLY